MNAHLIWGAVVIVIAFLASASFDQWIRRRYPLPKSVFKKGTLELQVSDESQILPLARACGMVEQAAPDAPSGTGGEG